MRLNFILVGAFLILALIIGLGFFISISASRKALQKSIGENSVMLAEEAIDKIDRNIFFRIEEFQEYSRDPELQESLIKSNLEFDNIIDRQDYINKNDQEWVSSSKEEITPLMRELIDNELSEKLRKRKEFYREDYGYDVYGEIFVTNKYGANVIQTGKTSDYYQADEDWWENARKEGLYVGDVEYDESTELYSVEVGIMVNDENGNFLGIIKFVLNIEEVVSIINGLEHGGIHLHEGPESINFKLLNNQGNIIYSSRQFEIFENFSRNHLQMFEEIRASNGPLYFMGEGDGAGEEDELFAYAYSRGYKCYTGLGWILVVEYDSAEIFASVNGLRNILLVISFIAILLAFLIGLFISYTISKPIKRLTEDVDRVSKGDFDVILRKSRIDEIQSLSNSLGRVLASMKLAVLKRGPAQRVKKEKKQIGEEALEKLGFIKTEENLVKEKKKETAGFRKGGKYDP